MHSQGQFGGAYDVTELFYGQRGFVAGRSCMTQLLITLELSSETLDSDGPLDVIYLDFRKAFDTVPHQRLTRKLIGYVITGKSLDWIRDFVSAWKQPVVVNSNLSSWASILSGIPSEETASCG